MRVRIKQDYNGGLYYGEVYDRDSKKWKKVTDRCFTKIGAMYQLRKHKDLHEPEEFTI